MVRHTPAPDAISAVRNRWPTPPSEMVFESPENVRLLSAPTADTSASFVSDAVSRVSSAENQSWNFPMSEVLYVPLVLNVICVRVASVFSGERVRW